MAIGPGRRFTIADAMILVPAAAVGLVALRSFLPGFLRTFDVARQITAGRFGATPYLFAAAGPGSCLVVPLMAALVALRFRRPRPPWSRVRDEPGFVACVAGLVALAPGLAWHAAIRHRPGFHNREAFDQVWYIWTRWMPDAVTGAWLALALAGRWRPAPDWVDRAGRVLGLFWVGLLAARMGIEAAEAIDKWATRAW